MKPKIVIFGLPPRQKVELKVFVFANGSGNFRGEQILQCSNNDSGYIEAIAAVDIEIGSDITVVIMSSGTVEYSFNLDHFNGADVSHVPVFRKETNTNDKFVAKDWDLDYWNTWNPKKEHEEGLTLEKQFLLDRTISTAPIWESYYADSNIDYFEKFQKLWIGLNAYMNYWSNESGDKKKTLSLVNSDLRLAFYEVLNKKLRLHSATQKWVELQASTGVNRTSDIVRDEINISCHWLDFFELASYQKESFPNNTKELEGIVLLNGDQGNQVFRNILNIYHSHMAGPQQMTEGFDLADAFKHPKSPESIKRIGRIVYHDPHTQQGDGLLTTLEHYFGADYYNASYSGQRSQYVAWEQVDPLFFRYLNLLYQFRCNYFHGDLPINNANNELARTAYLSLYEIFPSII